MLQLSLLFTKGCVLQRGDKTKIWGKATPSATVQVEFLGQSYTTQANSEENCLKNDTKGNLRENMQKGDWEVFLNDLPPGGPHTLIVQSDGQTIEIPDVLIGDVWLCGGQSNMEFPMKRVRYMYPELYETAQNDSIRQFTVPQRHNFEKPCKDLEAGQWNSLSPENIPDFTAVGLFFAQRLFDQYNIPIGLIATAVGGTPIHAWMGRDMLAEFPEVLAEADLCSDDAYINQVLDTETEKREKGIAYLDQHDKGLSESWYSYEYDDSNWDTRDLCTPWETGLREPGAIWFRRTLDIPKEMAGKKGMIFIGTLQDADTVYINGKIIGGTEYRYPPREYEVPPLPAGKCVIAVRVRNFYGEGGFTPYKGYHIVCGKHSIDLNGEWQYKRGVLCDKFEPQTFFFYKPTGLFNGMIAPLTNFAIKGAIWYQGESDTGRSPETYGKRFTNMINGWRDIWGLGDFPFMFTELTHYTELDTGHEPEGWGLLRIQQKAALKLPNTAMALTMDVGEYNDLHPQNKEAIGLRLARATLAVAYDEDMPGSPFILYGKNDNL